MNNIDDKSRVLKYINENRDKILEFLKTLIRYRTPNPPGRNCSQPQNWIANELRSMGFEIEIFDVFPGDPNVVGVLKGKRGGRSIILNGHIDVAEIREEETWKHNPFDPVIEKENNKGYGRVNSQDEIGNP